MSGLNPVNTHIPSHLLWQLTAKSRVKSGWAPPYPTQWLELPALAAGVLGSFIQVSAVSGSRKYAVKSPAFGAHCATWVE